MENILPSSVDIRRRALEGAAAELEGYFHGIGMPMDMVSWDDEDLAIRVNGLSGKIFCETRAGVTIFYIMEKRGQVINMYGQSTDIIQLVGRYKDEILRKSFASKQRESVQSEARRQKFQSIRREIIVLMALSGGLVFAFSRINIVG